MRAFRTYTSWWWATARSSKCSVYSAQMWEKYRKSSSSASTGIVSSKILIHDFSITSRCLSCILYATIVQGNKRRNHRGTGSGKSTFLRNWNLSPLSYRMAFQIFIDTRKLAGEMKFRQSGRRDRFVHHQSHDSMKKQWRVSVSKGRIP